VYGQLKEQDAESNYQEQRESEKEPAGEQFEDEEPMQAQAYAHDDGCNGRLAACLAPDMTAEAYHERTHRHGSVLYSLVFSSSCKRALTVPSATRLSNKTRYASGGTSTAR